VPTPRGDAPLTKHLAVPYGPDMARAWQALPYLVLPGAGFFDHLYDRQRDLKAARPVVCPRPGRGAGPAHPRHPLGAQGTLGCRLVRDSPFPLAGGVDQRPLPGGQRGAG